VLLILRLCLAMRQQLLAHPDGLYWPDMQSPSVLYCRHAHLHTCGV
jgi:hypothetical protein